jgi:hypothetical protein
MTKEVTLYPTDYYASNVTTHDFKPYHKFNQTTLSSIDHNITTANLSPVSIGNDVGARLSGDPYSVGFNNALEIVYYGGLSHRSTVEIGLPQDAFQEQNSYVNNAVNPSKYNQVKGSLMRNIVGLSFIFDNSGSYDQYYCQWKNISLGYIDNNKQRQVLDLGKKLSDGPVSGHTNRSYYSYMLDDADAEVVITRMYMWTSVFLSVSFDKDFLAGQEHTSGAKLFNCRPIIKSGLDAPIAANSTSKSQQAILTSSESTLQQNMDGKYIISTTNI